jgi:putative endonuclease
VAGPGRARLAENPLSIHQGTGLTHALDNRAASRDPSPLILSLSKDEGHPPMQIAVYILKCADGSYYIGNTPKPIEARLWEHDQGLGNGYTASRRPLELVYCEVTDSLVAAIARERQLKGWSRRKKEALIAREYHRLPELARTAGNSATVGPRPSTSSG